MQYFPFFGVIFIEQFARRVMEQLKKQLKEISLFLLAVCLLVSCSKREDEASATNLKTTLYAIVKPQGTHLTNITPDDYALTLDNILAVNPETGIFKMVNTERIDSVAFPIPTQHVIQFYSKGKFLFEARLNHIISSYCQPGLQFMRCFPKKDGAIYKLEIAVLRNKDGVAEGELTEQEQEGMKRMYQILKKAGKTTNDIDFGANYYLQ